jgi:hypothetical protein
MSSSFVLYSVVGLDQGCNWQMELTGLIWVFHYKVKRLDGSTWYVNPDFESETTVRQSHKSYQEIAAAFDPPKVSKTMSSSYLS